MRGRLLDIEEVLKLPDDTKVWVEDDLKYYKNQICIKNGYNLNFTDTDCANRYIIKEDGYDLERIDIYKYEEEIIIKEYTMAEVIGMIAANPELRFKNPHGNEIGLEVSLDCELDPKEIVWKIDSRKLVINTCTLNIMWTLVEPEPMEVSFVEAVYAFSKGKVIECRREEGVTKYRDGDKCPVMYDDNGLGINYKEILKGAWYIL